MVQFRLRKKLAETNLRAQHVSLELQMERHVSEWRRKAAQSCTNSENLMRKEVRDEKKTKLRNQARELIVQTETLRIDNAALREAVAGYGKLQKVIYAESDRLGGGCDDGEVLGGDVNFPDGEPSFFYYPFSKEECRDTVDKYDKSMRISESARFSEVWVLFGWQVERMPLTPHANGNWLITRVRFTKQIRCAAGTSLDSMKKLETESWPVLTTPELCPRMHRTNCTSLKVQEVDQDSVIIVSNTPPYSRGKHLRHLTLMHRRRTPNAGGKLSTTYVMAIPDSEANRRSRETESSRDKVFWICEGAAYMTLSQVDDSTLEVTYDNCSSCKNELHAQFLLMEWGQEAIRWEELVTPSRLISN
ncbi:unnamed protein product [Phytophthora lilii]|uniref:Unnamed protein product n=1 Tax=Phytophthora lilii TaxID=2077276 RepID=A0A9W6TMY8_9STRA|nr:unnamed protein product [Phytophthora lilii]